VVAVHEDNSLTQQTEDHLYLYDPRSRAWQRILTLDGAEGYGIISPDNSQVILEFNPKTIAGERGGQGRLWAVDLISRQSRKLTTNDEEGTWDTLPAWRADGQEIIFHRFRLSHTGVVTKLMRVSSTGGEPTVLAEGVVDACYSPDGKQLAIVTTGGLQIWDPMKDERKLIVPWDRLPNYKYLAVGLTWSKTMDKIAFAILNQTKGESELWTVSSEGKDAKKIFSNRGGRISFPAFIRNK
jgi:Tol biopolymer transport system component